MTRLALGACLVAAVSGAAASAGRPLTAPEFRVRADTICANEQMSSVARLRGAKSLAQYLSLEVPVLRKAADGLAALTPPHSLASLAAQVVTTVGGELTEIESLARRAAAGNLTEAQWQNDAKLEQLDARELALWKQIGATGCANP